MEEKMEKAAILEKVKVLVEDEEKEDVLLFFVDRSMEMVKAYCYITEIPHELYGVCASIAAALWKGKEENIKSIQEGAISVTFQEGAYGYASEKELLEQFSYELNRYRRIGL
ncbi:MAG: hypothetical protein GX299_02900 [Epulopiscium sp.]|nr:hypothetical protein [Candidatus Epulonipiscium sp.]